MNIVFFGPTNPFSALEDEWELQNNNASDAYQTATALKKNGDFLRGTQYGGKETINLSFIGKKITGNFTMTASAGVKLACGLIAAGYHIDTLGIQYSQTDQPKLDITGHKHLDGRGHGPAPDGDGGCRIYLPSLVFPALDIGVPGALAGVATGGAAFTLSDTCKLALRSINYQLQVNHVDEPDRVGAHLAGDNYDGTETLAIEFTGEFEEDDFELGDGWFRDTTAHPRNNTGVNQTTLNLTHHVAHLDGTNAPGSHDADVDPDEGDDDDNANT